MKRLALACLVVATTYMSADARRRPPPPDVDDMVQVPPPKPPPAPAVVDVETDVHGELTAAGDPVKLVITSGGKQPGARLEGKGVSMALAEGEMVGTLKTAHGITLIALAVDSAKTPFRIATFDGKQVKNVQKFARPANQSNYPFAIAVTRTPDGFTVFFQEVEAANPSTAHTFMLELDKEGKASGEPKAVDIPWALADAIWNGNGYHLALYYTGEMRGARLSMVSTTPSGQPQGHPDWATQPSAISDLHLVESGDKILAIYRGGAGDHMYSTDVTNIGQWGQVTAKTTDLGALAANVVIAINAKAQPTKIKIK